jgi:hypothetical protein
MQLSERERKLRIRLRDDNETYAKACLKIRTKSGSIEPLIFNSAQKIIHQRAEKQRMETGRVRALVLKGRQQGCSTYIQGRFYHKITHRKGFKAFILTHENEATNNLFEMTQRFHDNCPELMRPQTGASSAHELTFDVLDSGYKVGTAGNKGVGRSATIQLFHGSEVAFWPNPELHASGIMQAVPDAPDTEMWLESTSNGPNDFFHTMWRKAVAGESEFTAIFIPWFKQTEYAVDVPDDMAIAPDEAPLVDLYGLTKEQIVWRRNKITQLGGGDMGLHRFKMEYPCTPDEAFEESGENKLIPSASIRAAVKRNVKPIKMWKPIWGLDIGGESDTGDRTALAKRMANVLLEPVQSWRGKDPMQIAGLVKAEYDDTETILKPAFICVDTIFQGAGIVARLREMNIPVIGVNVAESSSISDKCNRLRDELWWKAREWFKGNDVVLPDGCDDLIIELASPRYSHTSSGKLVVESKDDMKERGISSPDLADAFNLTFAGPNIEQDIREIDRYARPRHSSGGQSWMTA